MTLYKVLIRAGDGVRSFYNDYTPYLPTDQEPGIWLPDDSYYLTDTPERHGLPGDLVFEAEGKDFQAKFEDQYIFRSIRLVKEQVK